MATLLGVPYYNYGITYYLYHFLGVPYSEIMVKYNISPSQILAASLFFVFRLQGSGGWRWSLGIASLLQRVSGLRVLGFRA